MIPASLIAHNSQMIHQLSSQLDKSKTVTEIFIQMTSCLSDVVMYPQADGPLIAQMHDLFLRLLSHSLRTSRSLRCDVNLFRAKLYLTRESFYTSISAQDQKFLYNLPSIYFCWFMTTPAEVQEVSRREALGLLTPEKLEEQKAQVGPKIDSNIWEWSFASCLVNRSFVVFSSCKLLEKTLLEVREYPLFKAQIKTLIAMKDFNDV